LSWGLLGGEVKAMNIMCPKCKKVQDVTDKVATCPECRSVLRRCLDCSHYDKRLSFCVTTNRPVDAGEAHYPTYSSASTYCRDYATVVAPD
jgi:hypothetical protein